MEINTTSASIGEHSNRLDEASSDDEFDEPSDGSSQKLSCIFTGDSYPSPLVYFTILKNIHNFDIWQIVLSDLSLDFFGYVKLINHLRRNFFHKNPPSSEDLEKTRENWDVDENFVPVIEDDPLLQFMLDDGSDVESEDEDFPKGNGDRKADEACSCECNAELHFLKDQLRQTGKRNKKLCDQLTDAASQIAKMKSFMQDVVLTGDVDMYRPISACRRGIQNYENEDEEFEDSGYFGTYSHHDIHSEMLQDTIRTLGYKNAILNTADTFRNKVVLDVGCGTGILSMFAAKAGASHVYGIDMSDIAFQAMDIIRENHFEDKVTILKGRVEEIDLPVSKVDIIISEWMGYFLLYESMLDTVLFARDKWLSDDGVMCPSGCDVSLVAIHDEKLRDCHVSFWEDVYGFQMSCLKKEVLSEAFIQVVNPSTIVSNPCIVHSIDVTSVKQKELNYKADFSLPITKSGTCSAIVGYFDIYEGTDAQSKLMFSTSPVCKSTHWKQAVFFLKDKMTVSEGDVLQGKIDCHKNVKDARSLIVQLTINNETQTYKIE